MRISDWSSDVCSSDLRALVERQVDQPAPALRHAFKHRPIGFSDLARLERGGKAAVRAWISRQQQAAAGVTVQPVHRRWTALKAKAQRVQHILRSEEHTSELQSLMRISDAVFCLKKTNTTHDM